MRHPALEQAAFQPLDDHSALAFRDIVQAALLEDGAAQDITTASLIAKNARAAATIGFRAPGVIAGLPVAHLAFSLVDATLDWQSPELDGTRVNAGSIVAGVTGSARSLLSAERVALNFLARLSGIATLTRAFVDAVAGLPVRIADTRKTTPGLRSLERYAVRAGGGFNHRFGLNDAVLIKDNHLAVASDLAAAVRQARKAVSAQTIVEVECETLPQVAEAVESGADAILLDNMSLDQLREAVKLAHGRTVLEASGGIMLGNVREVARTGVNIISVGGLTHGARALDIGLDFVTNPVTVEAQ